MTEEAIHRYKTRSGYQVLVYPPLPSDPNAAQYVCSGCGLERKEHGDGIEDAIAWARKFANDHAGSCCGVPL